MKISFVRHGKSEHNSAGVITGQIDSPLTDEGLEQARQTGESLPRDFSLIYSSDLIRCKQTAEAINEKLGLEIKYDSRLRERNFGSLGGKKWEEIDELGDLIGKDTNQTYDYRPFGGESVEDVKTRLMDFINEVKSADKGKKVLVVTHGGIIRLLHFTFSDEVHRSIGNSTVHEFEFEE